jgi:hypothetical protein
MQQLLVAKCCSGSLAEVAISLRHVRSTPESRHQAEGSARPLRANNGNRRAHSITSSARASSAWGTSKPSALAVFKLMTNSNLVGACTGRSPGRAPFKI